MICGSLCLERDRLEYDSLLFTKNSENLFYVNRFQSEFVFSFRGYGVLKTFFSEEIIANLKGLATQLLIFCLNMKPHIFPKISLWVPGHSDQVFFGFCHFFPSKILSPMYPFPVPVCREGRGAGGL